MPFIICTRFAKFIYNEYIRPYILSHIVFMIFASGLPEIFGKPISNHKNDATDGTLFTCASSLS